MDRVVCGEKVKPNFAYFCRGCYRNLQHKLGVSRSDFRKYLRYGLGIHLHISEDWDFKQMYDVLSETHPTLYNLANLIQNALFLKLLSHPDLHLEPSYCYASNDKHTSTNNRVVCYDYRWNYNKFIKQIYHQRCLL